MVYNWLKSIQFFAGNACLLCRGPTTKGLCASCLADLPMNRHACHLCAEPQSAHHFARSSDRGRVLCHACRNRTPGFDRIRAPLLYQTPVSDLVTALKYRHRLSLAPLLGGLLADSIGADEDLAATAPQCLIPVPAHPHRLRERGFNQATELAQVVSRRLGTRLDLEVLTRVQQTPTQTGLKRSQRLRNLNGAFRLQKHPTVRRVVVVDDVVTTGATAEAVAQVLKAGGVERVEVWAVARTPKSN